MDYGNITFTIGQFILQETESGDYDLYLKDKDNRSFPISQVALLSAQSSDQTTDIDFPRPYILNKEGSVLETGALVFIAFPKGNSFPVVLGALNFLGMQDKKYGYERINKDDYSKSINTSKHNNCFIKRTKDKSGQSLIINNGSYTLKSDYNSFFSQNGALIKDETELSLIAPVIDIAGGNVDPAKSDDKYNGSKAEEVNVFSDKINLGYSPKRSGKELEVDTEGEIENPKYQNSVMGVTLKALLNIFADIVKNATFMGNGVTVVMSSQDRNRLEHEFKEKLSKMLSEVVYLVSNKEVTNEEEEK